MSDKFIVMKKLILILSLALCAAFFGCQTEEAKPKYKLQKIEKPSSQGAQPASAANAQN